MEDPVPYVAGFIIGAVVVLGVVAILMFSGTVVPNGSTDALVKNFCVEKGYDTGTYKNIAEGIEITCKLDRQGSQTEMRYIVRNGEIFAWIF